MFLLFILDSIQWSLMSLSGLEYNAMPKGISVPRRVVLVCNAIGHPEEGKFPTASYFELLVVSKHVLRLRGLKKGISASLHGLEKGILASISQWSLFGVMFSCGAFLLPGQNIYSNQIPVESRNGLASQPMLILMSCLLGSCLWNQSEYLKKGVFFSFVCSKNTLLITELHQKCRCFSYAVPPVLSRPPCKQLQSWSTQACHLHAKRDHSVPRTSRCPECLMTLQLSQLSHAGVIHDCPYISISWGWVRERL